MGADVFSCAMSTAAAAGAAIAMSGSDIAADVEEFIADTAIEVGMAVVVVFVSMAIFVVG